MTFCRVAATDELWSGEKLGRVVNGRRILLVNFGGSVCAYEDRCRHKGSPLSEGRIVDHVLTCAAHGWEYDVRTGCGINPDNVVLERYEVKIEGADILVDLAGGGTNDGPT
jgi:toluene monooxygenase system ferredoxin subunit